MTRYICIALLLVLSVGAKGQATSGTSDGNDSVLATKTKPDPPTDVTVYRNDYSDRVILRWTAVPIALEYRVYSSARSTGPFDTLLGITPEPTWTDSGLQDRRFYVILSRFEGPFSDPSNTVGYVRIRLPAGTPSLPSRIAFGLPFEFWDVVVEHPQYGVESRRPSDICGVQANPGSAIGADRIVRQDTTSLYAYRNTSGTWTGMLELGFYKMEPGRAYWYQNRSGSDRDLVLAGQVCDTGNYTPIQVSAPAAPDTFMSTPISWRESRDVSRDSLNLLVDGFLGGTLQTSDLVVEQATGRFFYFQTSDSTWQPSESDGGLAAVIPGRAYWIINRHPGHVWTYNYVASGQP